MLVRAHRARSPRPGHRRRARHIVLLVVALGAVVLAGCSTTAGPVAKIRTWLLRLDVDATAALGGRVTAAAGELTVFGDYGVRRMSPCATCSESSCTSWWRASTSGLSCSGHLGHFRSIVGLSPSGYPPPDEPRSRRCTPSTTSDAGQGRLLHVAPRGVWGHGSERAERRAEREEAAFRASPAGQARTSYERGDFLFQVSSSLEDVKSIIVPIDNAYTRRNAHDVSEVLNSIVRVGWAFASVSTAFVHEGEESRERFLASGRHTAVPGRTYVFTRSARTR